MPDPMLSTDSPPQNCESVMSEAEDGVGYLKTLGQIYRIACFLATGWIIVTGVLVTTVVFGLHRSAGTGVSPVRPRHA